MSTVLLYHSLVQFEKRRMWMCPCPISRHLTRDTVSLLACSNKEHHASETGLINRWSRSVCTLLSVKKYKPGLISKRIRAKSKSRRDMLGSLWLSMFAEKLLVSCSSIVVKECVLCNWKHSRLHYHKIHSIHSIFLYSLLVTLFFKGAV